MIHENIIWYLQYMRIFYIFNNFQTKLHWKLLLYMDYVIYKHNMPCSMVHMCVRLVNNMCKPVVSCKIIEFNTDIASLTKYIMHVCFSVSSSLIWVACSLTVILQMRRSLYLQLLKYVHISLNFLPTVMRLIFDGISLKGNYTNNINLLNIKKTNCKCFHKYIYIINLTICPQFT